MDLKRTWAISRKELIHIRRDPISLLQIILLPIVLLLLYGYALTFDIKNVTLAIYDQERSQLSEDFINQLPGHRLLPVGEVHPELRRTEAPDPGAPGPGGLDAAL